MVSFACGLDSTYQRRQEEEAPPPPAPAPPPPQEPPRKKKIVRLFVGSLVRGRLLVMVMNDSVGKSVEEDKTAAASSSSKRPHSSSAKTSTAEEDAGTTASPSTKKQRRRRQQQQQQQRRTNNKHNDNDNNDENQHVSGADSSAAMGTRSRTHGGSSSSSPPPLSNNNHPTPVGASSSSSCQNNNTVVTYLLEEGRAGPDGKIVPTQLLITMTTTTTTTTNDSTAQAQAEQQAPTQIRLQPGDDVMVVQSSPEDPEIWWPPARIASFQEQNGSLFFTAQWFLSKHDISQLPQSIPWNGTLTRAQLLEQMGPHDIVLSNQTDDNDIGAILGLAKVRFFLDGDEEQHQEEEDEDDTTTSAEDGPVYQCRYQLDVTPQEFRLMPYTEVASVLGENTQREGDDDQEDQQPEHLQPSQSHEEEALVRSSSPHTNTETPPPVGAAPEQQEDTTTESKASKGGRRYTSASRENYKGEDHDSRGTTTATNSEVDSTEATVPPQRRTAPEGEGTVLRDSIEIGPGHQAVVPPFDPNQQPPPSRHPKLVWTPGMYTDEQLNQFLHGVAAAHTPFLEYNRLTSSEPYTPLLDPQPLDEWLKQRPGRLTGSSLSTASMLAGHKQQPRANLKKECDPDELLQILADSNRNIQRAIDTAVLDLDRITRGAWTVAEKARYNDGFRRHGGLLRAISKVMAPHKSAQDVVDYHFRCKIPDQFRQYQEQKREIAVRIVECMDERRAASKQTNNNNNNTDDLEQQPQPQYIQPPQHHWSETSVHDVATLNLEARRRNARQFMLQVQKELGTETLEEVAYWIRMYPEKPAIARQTLFKQLEASPELQRKLSEFLPPAI